MVRWGEQEGVGLLTPLSPCPPGAICEVSCETAGAIEPTYHHSQLWHVSRAGVAQSSGQGPWWHLFSRLAPWHRGAQRVPYALVTWRTVRTSLLMRRGPQVCPAPGRESTVPFLLFLY